MDDILLVFALEQESAKLFKSYNTLYTGVGKVQAAVALSNQLQRTTPKMVINLGTAGSKYFLSGEVVNPISFIQRDMDVTALGFEIFVTPFSDKPIKLEHGTKIDGLKEAVCGTGDNFSTTEDYGNGLYNIVDMEAYVLSHICMQHDVKFLSLKYISDGADDNANEDWNEALNNAASKMKEVLETVVIPQIGITTDTVTLTA